MTRHRSRRRPVLEALELRVMPSSAPLHVAGNQIENAAGTPVVLRGVNIISLEWRPDGDNLSAAVDSAIHDWHANLLRLPVNEDYWFGHDQHWTGMDSGDDGAAYRAVVDQVIATASANNVYVMLDLHWSDMGVWGANNGQHFLPDDNSTTFWQDAAARYANNPAVLFDPYNEPAIGLDQPDDGDFAMWRDGGTVTETDLNNGQVIGTYDSPGLQGLIDTIRKTGAKNIVAPEGLDWGSDLTGVLTGHALTDDTGELIYQSHLYPDKLANDAVASSVATVSQDYPIYVGEWGTGGVIGAPSQDAATSNQDMVAYLDQHGYSWTAWAFTPDLADTNLNLLTEWNADSPTSDFGAYVKANLATHAANQPPTVASAAHAASSPVTGKTTTLSARGADDGGETNLTYSWAVKGTAPAAVTFSLNGSHAAGTTAATFRKPGTYTFEVTIRDAGGLSVTSDVKVVVRATPSSIVVTPSSIKVGAGTSQAFKAVARDQFGVVLATQPAFAWSVKGGGLVTSAGVYQAPSATGTATVTATTAGIHSKATVNIVPLPTVRIGNTTVTAPAGSPDYFHTSGNRIVDAAGKTVRIAGVNWFGFETGSYVVQGLGARNYRDMIAQMKRLGFNTIRLPFSNDIFNPRNVPTGIDFTLNPDLKGLSSLQILDRIVAAAGQVGMRIILDHHSAKHDDHANEELWYIKGSATYTEAAWINDWVALARRYAGNATVIGADLQNEPHGAASWGDGNTATDWRLAAERAGNAILKVNPSWLMFVEGIQQYQGNWSGFGSNLMGAAAHPVVLAVGHRVVYSAHDYPASVYEQDWFKDPAYPTNLPAVWDRFWGYLDRKNIAPVYLGEFGSALQTTSDKQWYQKLTAYLKAAPNMSWTWWAWNANAPVTGGILGSDWSTADAHKLKGLTSLEMTLPAANAASMATFTLTLSASSQQTVTVHYATADGTARHGRNYTAVEGIATFVPGQTRTTVVVPILFDPAQKGDEAFTLVLSGPVDAGLAGTGSATATIHRAK